MACCAERGFGALAIALAACTAPACAQEALTLESRVVDAIAQRWQVPVTQLHIEWSGSPPGYNDAFTLNDGTRGEWLIVADVAPRRSWKLRAGVTLNCPVAARDLPRAAVLAATDIVDSTLVHWGPPARTACADVHGWTTRRPVRRGEALAAPAVAPPTAVRSGEKVRITFIRGTVALLLDGRAAGTGAIGDRILVNMTTGKRVLSTITGAGAVEVREAM